jgi:hypothetical protein
MYPLWPALPPPNVSPRPEVQIGVVACWQRWRRWRYRRWPSRTGRRQSWMCGRRCRGHGRRGCRRRTRAAGTGAVANRATGRDRRGDRRCRCRLGIAADAAVPTGRRSRGRGSGKLPSRAGRATVSGPDAWRVRAAAGGEQEHGGDSAAADGLRGWTVHAGSSGACVTCCDAVPPKRAPRAADLTVSAAPTSKAADGWVRRPASRSSP